MPVCVHSGQMVESWRLDNFINHTTSHLAGTRIGHAIADTLLQVSDLPRYIMLLPANSTHRCLQ